MATTYLLITILIGASGPLDHQTQFVYGKDACEQAGREFVAFAKSHPGGAGSYTCRPMP